MIYLFLALIFIGLQGFYAGMETGMVSVMRPRVEHAARSSRRSSARLVLFFVRHPGIMIATTLIGVNICVVGASLSTKKFVEFCGLQGSIGILVSTSILSIILLSCEIIPKNWFRQSPFDRCSHFIWLLYITYLILFIPVRLFAGATDLLGRVFSGKKEDHTSAVMREDFRLFLRESEGSGSVDSETAEILDKAMGFPALTLADIMTPKEDVLEIPSTFSVREAYNFARANKIDKLPVFIPGKDSEKQRWRAIFSVYEAMYSIDEELWDKVEVTGCITQMHSLKENSGISGALKLSKNQKVTLIVVTDDSGNQLGIVSPEKIASMLFE